MTSSRWQGGGWCPGGYRLGELLASGGSGSVHRGTAPDGSPVAIKLIHGGRPLEETERRRFQREAEALLRLAHPHLVRAREVVWEQGRAALVLELLAGEDLEQRLARGGPLPPREVARIGRDLARGLAHAHERGVIHRDLKPQNVLLGPQGRAVLVDFGLARDLALERSHLTRSGTLLGTPGYWPPEQARGDLERIGPSSDVYGLGATLYALLCGDPPVQAATLAEALDAIADRPPPPLTGRCPGLDPALAAIVHRCLAKRPEQRYPTAGALAEALEAWLAGAPARPAPARSAAPLLAAGLLVCGGGAAAAVLTLRGGAAPPAAREPAPEGPSSEVPASEVPGSEVPGSEVPGSEVPASEEPASDQASEGPASEEPASDPARGTNAATRAELAAERKAELDAIQADLKAQRLESAIARAERLCRVDPGDPAALMLLLRAREAAGRSPAETIPWVDRALAATPGAPHALVSRALLRFQLGRYVEALEDAELALTAPTRPLQRFERGSALYVRGSCQVRLRRDLRVAQADLDAALEHTPDHTLARMERGTVRGMEGDSQGSVRDLDMALALGLSATNRPRALVTRAASLLQLGRRLEAGFDFQAGLPGLARDDPVLAPSQKLMSGLPALPSWSDEEGARVQAVHEEALRALKDPGGAAAGWAAGLARLDAALAEREHPRLLTFKGAILSQAGRQPEAEAALRRAVALNPGYAEAWKLLGNALLAQRRREEGLDALWRGLSLDPRDGPTWAVVARQHVSGGKQQEGLLAYERALELAPGDGTLWNQRGVLRAQLKDLPGALADLDRALKLGHRQVGTLIVRASVLDQLNRLPEALAAYEEVLPRAHEEQGVDPEQLRARIRQLRATLGR